MRAELAPVGADDAEEPARKEAASPLRLFQADTFERAARRPLVALG